MKLLPHNFKEKIIYTFSMALSRWINGDKIIKDVAIRNILVFKLDEIGDLCYSLHVFDLLKENYSGANITLVCKSYCVSLVNAHPSIDKVITSFTDITGHYDLIVDLRGNFNTIKYAILNRPAIRLDRGTVRYKNKQKGSHPHEVNTNTQIIEPLLHILPDHPMPRLFSSQQTIKDVQLFLTKNGLTKFAVFHCGARRLLRRWPANEFAALAIWLKQKYQLDIVFTGDANDYALVEEIQKQVPFVTYNSCGAFNLSAFDALVKQAILFVGNESGPLCIASISTTPSLGLFGPGEPIVFYPYGNHTAYIHHILECNPCDQIHCVHPENPCIQRITLIEVKIKITELLINNSGLFLKEQE